NKELGEIALGSTFQADVIMTVADLSRMEVLSEIDENDVVLVGIGDTTIIEVDAIPDTTFSGVVSEIAHSATTRGLGTQEEVTNFEVRIAVLDVVEKLRPGMSCTVDIETETNEDVLYVPIQSVTVKMPREFKDTEAEGEKDSLKTDVKDEQEELQEVVFVIEGEYADIKPVETGISDDTNIEITGGLEEGMKVVSGSYRAISKTLKDGSLVKISKRNNTK
ncbi:MAG: efflux RND transporter periplasmic adaptor subunit, partial [candidate division KSB1 bacterium]|nr:efflux RND transporter periplasmic adaptor subunit [candidate division KSB1 bacterium]